MSKIEIIDNSISLVDQSRIETFFSDKFTMWYYDEYTVSTAKNYSCILYASPSPRDPKTSRMPYSA